MHRAHKIRLNPTPEQAAYFRKAAGTARFVYNWGLAEVKRALEEGRKPESVVDLKQRFNALKGEQYPWVYEVSKCVAEGASDCRKAAVLDEAGTTAYVLVPSGTIA